MSAKERRTIGFLQSGAVVLILILGALGCSASKPGPHFAPSSLRKPDHARIYIYRVDEVPSSGVARIQIQNEELGRLKNGQYLEIDIPAEPQPLSIFFHAWPMTFDWGSLPLDPESGKVYYLRLSASPIQWWWQWDESARDSEDNRGLRFEVSLLRSFRSAEAALPELERTRLSY